MFEKMAFGKIMLSEIIAQRFPLAKVCAVSFTLLMLCGIYPYKDKYTKNKRMKQSGDYPRVALAMPNTLDIYSAWLH